MLSHPDGELEELAARRTIGYAGVACYPSIGLPQLE